MNIAKYLVPIGIGAVYMFCPQASVPMTAIATIDPKITLRSGDRLPVKVWITSVATPRAEIAVSA